MMFELQKPAELDARRRKGLALSVALHGLLLLFFVLNPDFLSTSSRRVIRVEGEDYDRDRFELVELQLPPELAAPLPEVVEAPLPEAVIPAPEVEATPPPPPPEPESPPIPPPPVIGPDDLVADGARPDAPVVPPDEPPQTARLEPTLDPETAGNGEDGESGASVEVENELQPAESSEEEKPLQVAENTNPNALVLPNLRRQASSLINETLAERPLSGPDGSRDSDVLPNLTTDRPEILSDTRGYDFGPYMNQVINRVRTNWYALIPEAARIGTLRGRVVIVFTITSNGRIQNLRAAAASGASPLDRAAAAAIQASNPFPELPADFGGENLVLQFTFLYNMPEQQ